MNARPTDVGPFNDSLVEAIEKGDAEAVKTLCLAMTPQQRRACAAGLVELGQDIKHSLWPAAHGKGHWKRPANAAHHRAHDLATLACGDPEDLLNLVEYVGMRWEEASAFLTALGKDPMVWRQALQRVIGNQLAKHVWGIEAIQRLIASGCADRPTGHDYTTALIGWPRLMHWQSPGGWAARLEADPGLHEAFLAFFEEQGSAENNLASVEKYAKTGQVLWSRVFLDGIDQGHYTRAQLLEKTLGTLESDWIQMRAGWFSRFHQLLAPSADEMAPFCERYLGLTHSRIPPTVALALDALRTLFSAGVIQGADLLPSLAPVFYAAAKAHVLGALKLAQAASLKDPSLKPLASRVAMPGLLHPASDVQAAILAALHTWGLDEQQREELRTYATGIAQVHRGALSKLLGAATSEPAVDTVPTQAVAPLEPWNPLSEARRLRPWVLDAEGIERIAFALENPGAIDEVECALATLVQAAPLPAEQQQQCAPLLKRARKMKARSMPAELSRLLIFVLAGQRQPNANQQHHSIYSGPQTPTPLERFAFRIDDLIDQAAQGWGLIPISTPSHQGGFLDAAELQSRLKIYQDRSLTVSATELDLARQRALPRPTKQPQFVWTGGTRTREYDGHVTHSPHFDIRTQQGVAPEHFYLEHLALADLRYLASTMPGQLEPFFAEGSQALASNLDWWEARWVNQAYIERLLEPSTVIDADHPMAVLTLALALGGKQPGQTAMAVDALAQAHAQRRIDPIALGQVLQALFKTPLVKAKRYAASLGSAQRNNPEAGPLVFACVCDIVRAHQTHPIKDLGALLDLMLEVGLAQKLRLPPDCATMLQQVDATGKLKKQMQAVLTHLC
ncbi:hypothetical protein KIH07_13195 [Hydrogenophaga taeniospiralis]|uniref:DUF6493 family protein n=1 Tax=Hydrogenophaga taeniospiralis TaxID=65656 RepID=UPI001CFB2FDF|nr:DUF6493 family protein [Hydrogenophaga taeniospiralis]MCB4364697.1 hypothetical protein [Hydrogenophaga taeniospiralis]